MERNITKQLRLYLAVCELNSDSCACIPKPQCKILKHVRSMQYQFRFFKNVGCTMPFCKYYFNKAAMLFSHNNLIRS